MPYPSVTKFINWITGTPIALEDGLITALTSPWPFTPNSPNLPLIFRERLQTTRIYYVRKDGSDLNNGLFDQAAPAGTTDGAFLTIQHAMDVSSFNLDLNNNFVNILVRAGSYPENLTCRQYFGRGTQGHSNILVTGDSSDHTLVKITPPAGACITGVTNIVQEWTFTNLEVDPTNDIAVLVDAGSWVCIGGLVFGGTPTVHLQCENYGILEIIAPYTVNTGAAVHVSATNGGVVLYVPGFTHTFVGTPNFTAMFANASDGASVEAVGTTFSGACTGLKFLQSNYGFYHTGVIDPNSIFPGSINGVYVYWPYT